MSLVSTEAKTIATWSLAGDRRPLRNIVRRAADGRHRSRSIDAAEGRLCLQSVDPLFRKSNLASKHLVKLIVSRSNSTEDICIEIPFGPPLAGLN